MTSSKDNMNRQSKVICDNRPEQNRRKGPAAAAANKGRPEGFGQLRPAGRANNA
jgi:hypothetical protein